MADPGVSSTYLSSRPVLCIDGKELDSLGQSLLSMIVEDTTDGLARCELTLGNWGESGEKDFFVFFKRDLLEFGKTLAIKVGEGATAGTIFEGRIMGLEGHFPQSRAPEVLVLAEDRLQDLRMNRRSRSFDDSSDADVIRQIAGEHGLSAEIDLEGPTYKVLAQINQTDLAFVRERVRAVDGEVWFEKGKLHAQSRAKRQRDKIELTLGRSLLEFSVLADLAHQRSATVVSGYSVANKEGLSFRADQSGLSAELAGMEGGTAIVENALGSRVRYVVHHAVRNDDEARALATAHHQRAARGFVRGTGIAQGDGKLAVGGQLELKGLGPLFNGSYYITETSHLFDAQLGYRTRFRVERPGLGRP